MVTVPPQSAACWYDMMSSSDTVVVAWVGLLVGADGKEGFIRRVAANTKIRALLGCVDDLCFSSGDGAKVLHQIDVRGAHAGAFIKHNHVWGTRDLNAEGREVGWRGVADGNLDVHRGFDQNRLLMVGRDCGGGKGCR